MAAATRGLTLVDWHASLSTDARALAVVAGPDRSGVRDEVVTEFMGQYASTWDSVAPHLGEPSILALFLPPADPSDPERIHDYLAHFRGPMTALVFPTIICAENEFVDMVARFPDRPLLGLELHMAGINAPLPKWASMAELVATFDTGRLWKFPE